MDIDCQSLVGNQFDGYGIRAPVAFAHLVIKLGYGIFAHAKVLYEDDTIAARGEGAVIVLAGDAEREALQLPVAAGLDDLQISTVGLVNKTHASLVLYCIGFAVRLNGDIVNIFVQVESFRRCLLTNQHTTEFYVLHFIEACLHLFHQTQQSIFLVQLLVPVDIAVDFELRTAELVIRILLINLGQTQCRPNTLIDDFNLNNLFVLRDLNWEDIRAQHIALRLPNLTDVPDAFRDVFKVERPVLSRCGGQDGCLLVKLTLISRKQSD